MSMDIHSTAPMHTINDMHRISKAITERTPYDVEVYYADNQPLDEPPAKVSVWVRDVDGAGVVARYDNQLHSYNLTLRGDYGRNDMLTIAASVLGSWWYYLGDADFCPYDVDDIVDDHTDAA